MELKNRIYMPAMHLGMAFNFEVTDRIIAFYKERAKGGAGLICVGYATVDERSGNMQNIGAHDNAFIPGLTKLADAIHENGSKCAVQINHAGRYSFSMLMNGKKSIAPSPIPSTLTREVPEEMTAEMIQSTIKAFADAALRVKKAGFDAVEILCGTGYLISEFLSPLTNERTDEYGGCIENRMRFGLEVISSARKAVGDDYPIIVRMNGNDFMEDGQNRQELWLFAKTLESEGVDSICVNAGWHEARVPQIVSEVPRGVFSFLTRAIKERVDIPVIASHRINTPAIARKLIGDGICDMVAMGRSLIADPYLPLKAETGQENEITHCIACSQGCFDNLFKLQAVECLCNPLAGHENDVFIKPAEQKMNIMVIGGGIAGMSAAVTACKRGHNVSLYEKSNKLGGQIYLAAAPPGREEFLQIADDLINQLLLLNVHIYTNAEVDEELVIKENPHKVILATGAVPIKLDIKGINNENVIQAWDLLQDKAVTGNKVVIIGGGAVGVETALFLADKGTLSGEALKFVIVNQIEKPSALYDLAIKGTKQITLVEMTAKIGQDIGRSTKWVMMQDLSRYGVIQLTGTKALEITNEGLKVQRGKNVEIIEADTIVLASGAAPYNPLEEFLKSKEIEYKKIGDAKKIGLAFDAVHQGFAAGNSI